MKLTIIRAVPRLVVNEDFYLEQLDVKTTFLRVIGGRKLYDATRDFEVMKRRKWCADFKKKLYVFKQVSRQWYKKFNSFMNNNGFKMC